MNFYGLKSRLEIICVSYSSHIVTAIQEKAQLCQFFTGSNSTVVEDFDFTLMVGTSAF